MRAARSGDTQHDLRRDDAAGEGRRHAVAMGGAAMMLWLRRACGRLFAAARGFDSRAFSVGQQKTDAGLSVVGGGVSG